MATTLSIPTVSPALPEIGDVVDADALGDDILASAAASDPNTAKILRGGTVAKYAPRAWSYGGSVD